MQHQKTDGVCRCHFQKGLVTTAIGCSGANPLRAKGLSRTRQDVTDTIGATWHSVVIRVDAEPNPTRSLCSGMYRTILQESTRLQKLRFTWSQKTSCSISIWSRVVCSVSFYSGEKCPVVSPRHTTRRTAITTRRSQQWGISL